MRALALALIAAIWSAPGASAQTQPYPGIPDPGGDPSLPVSVPPPGEKLFGYNEPTVAQPAIHGWTPEQIAEASAGGGANLARFTVQWWSVEPSRNMWSEGDWAIYARIYNAYLARGIRPIITVMGVPVWAREPLHQLCSNRRGCEFPPRPSMDGEWQQYVAEVARRFPLAAAIEVWNEPNLRSFYKPEPNPNRYADLLIKAFWAVKAVDHRIPVLGGALAPQQEPSSSEAWAMKRFLEAMYVATPGVKNHMDGLSFHTVWQSLDYGAGSAVAKFFHDVRSITAKYGDAGMPLWITELGLTTNGPQAMSGDAQAFGLLSQYRKVMQMPDFKGLIIHTLADRIELPASDFNRGLGVIAAWQPFTPKPAYCAFAGRVDTPTPYGGCPKIVDPPPPGPPPPPPPPPPPHDPKGCSGRMIAMRGVILGASGDQVAVQRRAYRELSKRCVPGLRRIARVNKAIKKTDKIERRRLLRKRRGAIRRATNRCRKRLLKIEHKAIRAANPAALDKLRRRHNALRRTCGKKRA